MSNEIEIPTLRCTRCRHEWHPRKPDKPRVCPRCNSPYWDIPKKDAEETFLAELSGTAFEPAREFRIVTICGSTRFKEEFQDAAKRLEKTGHIVLTIHWFHHADGEGWTKKTVKEREAMHFRRIEMSHKIYVVNVDGYIGESTAREIGYAEEIGREVEYMCHPNHGSGTANTGK